MKISNSVKSRSNGHALTNGHDNKNQVPLRDVLIGKLKDLAMKGDTKALLELLDRPALLDPPQADVPLTHEAAKQALHELLEKISQRARAVNPNYEQELFEERIENRFRREHDNDGLEGWKLMLPEERLQMWSEIQKGCRQLAMVKRGVSITDAIH